MMILRDMRTPPTPGEASMKPVFKSPLSQLWICQTPDKNGSLALQWNQFRYFSGIASGVNLETLWSSACIANIGRTCDLFWGATYSGPVFKSGATYFGFRGFRELRKRGGNSGATYSGATYSGTFGMRNRVRPILGV